MNTLMLLATTALSTIEALAPLANDATTIGKVIDDLEIIVPIVETVANDLAQPVKNIIAILQNNGAITDDQIAATKALDAKMDAAFDASLAAWNAANPPDAAT